MSAATDTAIKSAEIVRDAGGEIVGRTRLQKAAYLLELVGMGTGFKFEIGEFGPYSSGVAKGIKLARALDFVREEERRTDWGGFYSIYRYSATEHGNRVPERAAFLNAVLDMSAVTLELAATALFICMQEGRANDAWEEIRRRKPSKAAEGRLELAVEAYQRLCRVKTPRPLPLLPWDADAPEAADALKASG